LPAKKTTTAKKTTKSAPAKKTQAAATTKAAARARTSTRKKTTAAEASAVRARIRDGQSLVVVESPAKAKTLQKYLGSNFMIEASRGHVKDLPTNKLGVDIERGFQPEYVIVEGKERILAEICANAKKSSRVFLATDPDREGEAIAWHIAEHLREHNVTQEILRATFNEITKQAVQEAIANPHELDQRLYDAQQARRILDRLVGYQLSPLLWKKVMRGLSAGRVQSVAVRLIVEREREIEAFRPEEYWTIEAECSAATPPPFKLQLTNLNGAKPKLATATEAKQVLAALGATQVQESTVANPRRPKELLQQLVAALATRWTVKGVERKEVRRRPAPPFITSTLQQEAARKLGFSASQTMAIAQRLYEGVELGEMGMTALITYMRTDSTRLSPQAVEQAREFIRKTYGDEYLPAKPNVYQSRRGAQDAHEAIRPTDLSLTPQAVAPYLEPRFVRLYELIWNRFLACQMADAIFEQTRVEVEPREGYLFTATGLVSKFRGFLALYDEGKDETENGENGNGALPELKAGDTLQVRALRGLQHFTQPPPRFTEASLIRELERLGIGRPSTYATIVSTIQERKYVDKDESKRFYPTKIGTTVTDLLVEHFSEILDVNFTAQMEAELDEVEEGKRNWQEVLQEFYARFKHQLEQAIANMRNVRQEAEPTDIVCDKCGKATMVIRWGRRGRFLACSDPECGNTRNLRESNGKVEAVIPEVSAEKCPECGRPMVIRSGRFGRFLACTGYPDCKTTRPLSTGVKCPECGAGELTERQSKGKKVYFACSNYPACKFVTWDRPVLQACTECGHAYVFERLRRKKRVMVCPNCKAEKELEEGNAEVTSSSEASDDV
jgi:DNA topoisomerase-1